MQPYTKEQMMRYIELLMKLDDQGFDVRDKIDAAVQSLHNSFEVAIISATTPVTLVDGGKGTSTIAKDILNALKNGGGGK